MNTKKITDLIYKAFVLLFFLTPIILFPKTSELFEFNKMLFVYASTTLILGLWTIKIILDKKFRFKKTRMDIPFIVFLVAQIISTLVSIDPRTSLLGHYSRFNGGLASSFSYVFLYWAYVNNIDKEKNKKIILTALFSSVLVSVYGILQHFGIDKDLWVQDVKARVFSTLGQPNWLAAMLVGLIPLTWHFYKTESKKVWGAIFGILFLTLLFTKSRSGILGFSISFLVYWFIKLLHKKLLNKRSAKPFFTKNKLREVIFFSSLIGIILVTFETPWIPNIEGYIKSAAKQGDLLEEQKPAGPALETGGTESGKIRQIVWKGAFETWKKYPIFGTGVETFASSYYNFKPIEHNLISEWDFVYNKAHNEFLNYLSTTGIVGLLSYLWIIASFFFLVRKQGFKNNLNPALVSGYTGLLVTNFFGFSVVVTSLMFFLFPAFAVAQKTKREKVIDYKKKDLTNLQKFEVVLALLATGYLLISISHYWYADVLYNKGKILNTNESLTEARGYLSRAVVLSSNEAIFWNELSQNSTNLAVLSSESSADEKEVLSLAKMAIEESDMALSLSPRNVNLLRSRSIALIKLSIVDPKYLEDAEKVIKKAITLAPVDAKLYYNLGLAQARLGKLEESKNTLEKAVNLKTNYVNARFALGLILSDLGERENAVNELQYILDNLDPNNALIKAQLEEVR